MPEIKIKQYSGDYDYCTENIVEVEKAKTWTNHIVIDDKVYDIKQLEAAIDLIKKFS